MALKKKNRSYMDKLRPVKLYLDDIRNISKVYEENKIEYSIDIDDYQIESIDDLKEIKEPYITKMNFNSYPSGIYLWMDSNKTDVHYEDDSFSIGVANKLKDILKKRTNYISYLTGENLCMIYMFIFMIIFMLLLPPKGSFPLYRPTIIIIFIVSLILYFIGSMFLFMKQYTIIYLKDKISEPNFFIRNKDKLYLLIIGAILGFLFTIISQMLFKS
jgi:hypothetical protein